MLYLNDNFKIIKLQNTDVGLDLNRGQYFIINDVAKFILNAINSKKILNKKQIVVELLDQYSIDEETIEKDVDEFLNTMIDKGWINEKV